MGVGPVSSQPISSNVPGCPKDTNEIAICRQLSGRAPGHGLQRVLAANLATLLPTDQIRLSAWQNADVAAEVYVAVEQFDVDARGQGVIVAWWHVLSPGGEKTLKSGECRLARQGPPPDTDPAGAVATLSDLAAELSRQLAQAVKETTPTPGQRR